MPSRIARTDAVDKALSRRQWGGPFAARASVCGRDALGWSRAWLTFGRPSLLGTTVKDPQQGPTDRVADAPRTWGARPPVSVPTPVGGGGVLGVRVVAAATTAAWETGDSECARAAQARAPDSPPRAVCTAGGEATRQPWRRLLPTITLVRGLLHALLTRKDRGTGALRPQGLARAWKVSQATPKRPGAPRLRRVAAWTPTPRRGAVAVLGLQRCRRRADCTPASDGPQAPRTAQAVDRLRHSHDRRLDARRSCHATPARAAGSTRQGAARELSPVWRASAA